jgi:hypothetical protein
VKGDGKMSGIQEVVGYVEERKRIDAIYWGGSFLWAGLVFGAESLGLLPQIGNADAWSWIFFGAGLYALLGNIYRLFSASFSRAKGYEYVWAGALMLLGLGGFTNIEISFALVLVLIGVAVLGSTIILRE